MALLFVAKLREEKGLAHLMLDPALQQTTGKYFERMNERASSQESYEQHKAVELWETSAELVQLQSNETILQVRNSLAEGEVTHG